MTDLLDAAIANTNRGPRIKSEQHDVNKIDVGSAAPSGKPSDGIRRQIASISSGGWDAAEYGISAAAQIVKLEESLAKAIAFEATPEGMAKAAAEAERVLAEMRTRAINRAGLDTSTGKVAVFVAGKAPWHSLGVNVEEAVTSADAIRLASLDWKVQKSQLQFRNPRTGELEDAEGQFGIVREDTGAMLGAVGKVYQPFQNSESFSFTDQILEDFGAKYESAGALYGGKRIWLLVHLPQSAFAVNGKDEVEPYALFTNAHDGTAAARCFPTTFRPVCGNTLRVAMGDKDKGLVIRHTGSLKARVESARQVMGIAVKQVSKFKQDAEVLVKTKVDPLPYFEGLLDAVLEVTKAEALKGADVLAAAVAMTEADRIIKEAEFNREIEKRSRLLEDVLARYESGTNGVNGMRGTGWSALNAVTEAVSNGDLGGRHKGKDKASRRFESVISGTGDQVNQIAYERVMQLVG